LVESTRLAGFTVDQGHTQSRLAKTPNSPQLVPTLSLDDAIERYGLRPPEPVKMDVEGTEPTILSGERRTLERYQPPLFIALHGEEKRRLRRIILREAGYRIHDLA
jgi:FkbM family methyltransferase